MILFSFSCTMLSAQDIPHYQIQVRYEHNKIRLRGTVKVSVPAIYDEKQELLFFLPMNRFQKPDKRGPIKILQTPVFALDDFSKIRDDPMFPRGFREGKIIVLSVKDSQGHDVPHTLAANPHLPNGYNIEDAILQIPWGGASKDRELNIDFETYLPERFQEGVVKGDLVTVEWHPKLFPLLNKKWETSTLTPSLGTYEVEFESTQSGTLITSLDLKTEIEAKKRLALSPLQRPVKYYPLIFSPAYKVWDEQRVTAVKSLYFGNDQRRAELLQQWGEEFLAFLQEDYGLSLPWPHLNVVEIRGNHEQIEVYNNLILVTTPHYKRTAILDRRVLGFFIRGLASAWFGETVFNDRNKQLWLNMGMTAYFSLKFYEKKYGKDVGIFNFMDWLNPRYKEHFYESMVRRVRPELQQPIISSIQDNPETRVALRMTTYKSALVINMLEWNLGQENFRKGLRYFYLNKLYQSAEIHDFQDSLELASAKSLQPLIQQWFHSIDDFDVALKNTEYAKLDDDNYEVRINIAQLGKIVMPVDVQVTTEDGKVYLQRSQGVESSEEVVFITSAAPEKVSLDPEEFIPDNNRINNHSHYFFRVRFAFDWKKDREVLITLIPRVGSNAIDGNAFGIEANNVFNEYSIGITPGYGTKNQEFLYLIQLERKNFLVKDLSLTFRDQKLGGIDSKGFTMSYSSPTRQDKYSYGMTGSVAQEHVFRTDKDEEEDEEDEEEGPVETGDTSNFSLSYTGSMGYKNFYSPSWSVSFEQPLIDFGADFTYTLGKSKLTHTFNLGFQKRFLWSWIYFTSEGVTPLQKKHQLGSPEVLRGFPQRTVLRDDQLLASRMEFNFPIVSNPIWGNVTSLGLNGIIFYDIGKVWSTKNKFDDSPERQDAGIGVQWGIDAVALLQIPFRLEVAYPLNDKDFTKPQFVFLGALSFF